MNENQEEETLNKTQNKFNIWAILKEIVIFAIVAFGIVLPFRIFIAEPYIVSGASMDPTFETGHYLIVDKVSHKFNEIKRNSVVIFKFPKQANIKEENGKNLIKRVIGLPGDTIIAEGYEIKIINKENPDGFILDQSYITHKLSLNFTITLKENQYFVMGDNRRESYDSRSWGVLPKEDILGKPVLRLLPLNKINILPGNFSQK